MMRGGRSFSGHERNCCFLNTGAAQTAEERFVNISAVSGLDYPDDGRAVALVDWDQDGDLDIWTSNRNAPRLRLMRNDVPQGNHFLALRLVGNGTSTNRDGIGARVQLVLANPQSEIRNPQSVKTLRAGEGFLAQSSKWLLFGLGANDVIEKVTVHWPGGDIEQFGGLEADHRCRLVQGTGTARDVTPSARKTRLVPSTQKVSPPTQVARIALVELLAMPKSSYVGFDGRQRQLRNEAGRLLLVNLWASWCRPCLAELREFSKRYEEMQAKGIDVLALSVDGLGPDASAEAKGNAARLVSERKFPFPVGQATEALIAEFQHLHDFHIPLYGKMPLPSSFLIDRQGRLAVIYKGPVSVDDLLKDVVHSEQNRLERFARSAAIAGQPIRHPQTERTAAVSAAFRRSLLADHLQQSGRVDEAVRQYEDALKFQPDNFRVHESLGNVLQALGRNEEAISHYREVLRIRPDHATSYFNLGVVLQKQGKILDAIEHYHQALRINPDDARTHTNLGVALQGQGKFVDATEHYQQALRINPEDAKTHTNLGVVLNMQGKFAKAIGHFRQALRIQPDHAQAHAHLGIALGEKGDVPTAIQHYTRALELKPDFPMVLHSLARIRATHPDAALRDGAQAVALAERCCQLTRYRVATVLATLAAAYAEVGRFNDAIAWQTKAVERARASHKADFQMRLELYKAGKPYRRKS